MRSDSDDTKYNGEAHGRLYSPDNAVRINKKIEGQGDLYAPPPPPPPHEINHSQNQQQQQRTEVEEKDSDEEEAKRSKPEAYEERHDYEKRNPTKSSSKL